MSENGEEIVRVRFTWTYETEVPRRYLGEESQMGDISMEAYTQGDGDQKIEVIS